MKYHLRVYDNYHYGDESEAYNHGAYNTYEKAESAAKAIMVKTQLFCHLKIRQVKNSQQEIMQMKLLKRFALNLKMSKRKWKFKHSTRKQ